MHNSHVTHLLVSLLCIGLTAQSELETDEVVPRLLSGQEAHLSTDHTFRTLRRRGQRSLDVPGGGHSDLDNIILTLPAFGRDLYLNLTWDSTFLSGDFEVEERRRDQSAAVRRLSMDQLCFYSGSIINHTDSLASMSTCGGLTGLVQIGEDSLFIQPLGENDPSQSFSGLKHRLSRRRRSSKTGSAPDADQPSYCGTVQGKRKEKRSKIAEEGRGKRNAIRLHEAYTVETVVVADSDMVQYHGAEAAQRFLLTVMNMVYNMFHHQSLGVRINIRVTKLVLLHSRPEKLSVGHHGERSLESFCHWQYQEFGGPRYLGTNHVPGGRDDIPPVDTAVLVTRTDFCVHKDEPCDTVGIAYLGGVCSAKRKCVLAEDNGLNLAFTIAHELGHNMGMSHDDDHTTCTGHSHIMSGEWVKGRNPSDLSWSSCSRDDLENFLRSKASACLLHTDPRSRYQVRLPPKLPGMHYSVDEQCQILFGTNATFCNDMEHLMCAGLWCLVEGDASCKTKLDPPLDGTECGADKWCRAGECVSKTPIPQHVDGDWSPWSQWSMCSRTCGTGVQFRQRKCDNPPPGPGGRHCQKASVEHKACEGPPCPKGAPSFRDLQCLSYDRHASKKKGSMLTAIINDEKPCVLFCSPVGRDVPALMADRVMDGTPCGPYEADLCVNGRCQKIGCDGVIGSSAKEDRCGVCNGDGRSCKIVRGDFNHTKGMVTTRQCKRVSTCVMAKPRAVPKCFSCYIEAVVIPAGARRIKVVEDKPSHSFLALKDSSKRSINSDWKIELPGEFELAGTTVRYVRRGLWEKMSAKGPTKTPLHLMVLLFHDQSYGIHYEYTVSLNTSQDRSSEEQREQEYLYIWTHSSWQDCTVQCGGGERRTVVSCMRIANKTMEVVNDSYCQLENRPQPQVRLCNSHPCQYRWVTGEWGSCSVTCGKGLQQREVVCVYHLQNGSLIHTRDLYCQGGKPPVLQGCEGRLCLTVWEASEWSKCSSDCGQGVRRRVVSCTNPQGLCDPLSQPTQEEPCEDHSRCYEWKTGDWSKCSSSCGKGLQSRVVQCMHKVTGRHGNDCPVTLRPPTYRPCHHGACNEKINVNTITSPRLAALTYKCMGDQWTVYCRVIREKNLCQDMRWYQRCCETCRDFYAKKILHKS
ncbi:A disintegrin and metalloproteinase with thrombospondin motifs 17 isoform X2 [Seriola aureovittata]|uniref:A disintegrin and metalloproteinase with thrombospondin motifs 17 isoform X2 n=1 Tax=Seriola aureovittata TaxID=2871759 RepID=UPI0024BE2FA0|nr:A disintegrin and metalloproteinase with thrombospondin motifs 17 isoform X2 [Seriola aureovittata]